MKNEECHRCGGGGRAADVGQDAQVFGGQAVRTVRLLKGKYAQGQAWLADPRRRFPLALLTLAISAIGIGTMEFVMMGLLPHVADSLCATAPSLPYPALAGRHARSPDAVQLAAAGVWDAGGVSWRRCCVDQIEDLCGGAYVAEGAVDRGERGVVVLVAAGRVGVGDHHHPVAEGACVAG